MKNRRHLTDNGLMVMLSIMLIPSCILICADSLLLVAIALLWGACAVVIAKAWAPEWANEAGKKWSKWLEE